MPEQNTLDIVIRMLADGQGAQVTKNQLAEIDALATKYNSAGNERLAQNARAVAEGIRGTVAAARSSAAEVGQAAGEEVGAHLGKAAKQHLFTVLGQLIGVQGLGSIGAAGGTFGFGLIAAMTVMHKGMDVLAEKFQAYENELKATADLAEKLKQAQQFSPTYLQDLHEAAEGLSDAQHKTAEWTDTLTLLHSQGLNPAQVRPFTDHIKRLASLLGGDLKAATALATAELQNNFAALEKLGIVVDATASFEERLADAAAKVALRTVAFGASAVSAAPLVRELAEATAHAKDEATEMEKETTRVNDALQRQIDLIREKAALEQKESAERAGGDKARIQADHAEGKITKAQADQQIAERERQERLEKFTSEYTAKQAELAKHQEAAGAFDSAITQRGERIDQARGAVDAAKGIEQMGGTKNALEQMARYQDLLARHEKGQISGPQEVEMQGLAGQKNLTDLFGGPLFTSSAQQKYQEQAGLYNADRGALESHIPGGFKGSDVAQKEYNTLRDGQTEFNEKTQTARAKEIEAIGKLEQSMQALSRSYQASEYKAGQEERKTRAENKTQLKEAASRYLDQKDHADDAEAGGRKSKAVKMPRELEGRKFHRDASGEVVFDDEPAPVPVRPQWQGPRQPPREFLGPPVPIHPMPEPGAISLTRVTATTTRCAAATSANARKRNPPHGPTSARAPAPSRTWARLTT